MKQSGQALYRKAKTLIPGGTQLLSKRPEMFLPEQWPAYYSHCQGTSVWGLDGKKYVDTSIMGVGTCILGYADPDVNAAVQKAVRQGSMCTLNCPEEVELAELLCDLHPWAAMVRYARCGGEAMSIASRIARSATGRDVIAFCGYHGWHDWYLSANLANDKNLDGQLLPGLQPSGVPRGLLGTVIPFEYKRRDQLDTIVREKGSQLAAIIMEPGRSAEPDKEFLQYVRETARKAGAVLVFDEVTSGWRTVVGGIHLNYGVFPDMAVFAKGMSNGYPMAAVIGTREVMSAAQKTFISSTYWTERIGPTAALATIRKMKKCKVPRQLIRIGKMVQEGWRKTADHHQLPVSITGIYPLSYLSFSGEESLSIKTLFNQWMLEAGFLASTAFYASYAHTPSVVVKYLAAVDRVFGKIASAKKLGELQKQLKGPVVHSGFRRLT